MIEIGILSSFAIFDTSPPASYTPLLFKWPGGAGSKPVFPFVLTLLKHPDPKALLAYPWLNHLPIRRFSACRPGGNAAHRIRSRFGVCAAISSFPR